MLRKTVERVYEKNHTVRNLALSLGLTSSANDAEALKSSRMVEYPWILHNLDDPKPNNRLLDIGSVGSNLPVELVSLGYGVWSIDVRKYEYSNFMNSIKFFIGDITQTNFEDNYFDSAVAVSTLEHIGLGRYGDNVETDGDFQAVKEISRITAKNGSLLITVPFGKSDTFPNHRVYDQSRLDSMLGNYKIEKIEYFIRNTKGFWEPCLQDKLVNVRSPEVEMGLVCVKGRKQ
jgi:SAM-dependent methyltransferase